MKNWNEFQSAHPKLQKIEETYLSLHRFLKAYPLSKQEVHGLDEADLKYTREAVLEEMKKLAKELPGRVYYWLFPFYKGDFMKLVSALGACGAMGKQRDDPESRRTFYRFFRTVPVEERLKIGERLNQPELTAQSKEIQDKIKVRKTKIKLQLDQLHAN